MSRTRLNWLSHSEAICQWPLLHARAALGAHAPTHYGKALLLIELVKTRIYEKEFLF